MLSTKWRAGSRRCAGLCRFRSPTDRGVHMAKRARPTSRYGKSAQVGRETGRHSPQRLIPPELGAREGYAGRPGRAGGTIALAARGKKKKNVVRTWLRCWVFQGLRLSRSGRRDKGASRPGQSKAVERHLPKLCAGSIQGVREGRSGRRGTSAGRRGDPNIPPVWRESTARTWTSCPTRGTRGRSRPGGATALAAGQQEHNSRMGMVPYKGYERSE